MSAEERIGRKNCDLAGQFAKQMKELARRNDFGGLYKQAAQNFIEAALVNVWYEEGRSWVTRYALPDGNVTTKLDEATDAWAR